MPTLRWDQRLTSFLFPSRGTGQKSKTDAPRNRRTSSYVYRHSNWPESPPPTPPTPLPPIDGPNDLKVLLVGEPHIGKRGMIPSSFVSGHRADSRDEFEYFTLHLNSDMLKDVDDVHTKGEGGEDEQEPRRVWTVGFYDHSLMGLEADPLRWYRRHIFDAVAICYDPCSPRESFKLVWTKVCS
jgi:hypothetical protein